MCISLSLSVRVLPYIDVLINNNPSAIKNINTVFFSWRGPSKVLHMHMLYKWVRHKKPNLPKNLFTTNLNPTKSSVNTAVGKIRRV